MNYAVINGTGGYLPVTNLTNYELPKHLDTNHDWIFSRTGISSRCIANEQETTSYMAACAAKDALRSSTISADDLDLILVATCTPDHFFPSIACHVQKALAMTRCIPAFDISAACSGFVYALDIAKQYITTGAAQNVMIVGSESMSRAVSWHDRATCVLFGDGAGAVILSLKDTPGVMESVLHASFDEQELLTYPNKIINDQRALIGMKGNEVFKLAINRMGDAVDEVLSKSSLKKTDIAWLIPHQANIRIIYGLAKKLNLSLEQIIITIKDQANTSAASIPLAIDHGVKKHHIKRGDILLLESFGGGMTWGAMLIRY